MGLVNGTDYDLYMASPEWADIRRERLEVDNYECRVCGRKSTEVILHVHHKRYDNFGGNEDIENDLTTLCEECHETITPIARTRRPRSEFAPIVNRVTPGSFLPSIPIESNGHDSTIDYPVQSESRGEFNMTVKEFGSGIIPGVGSVMAGWIYERFGKNTLNVIIHRPELLRQVSSLGPRRVEAMRKYVIERFKMEGVR